MIEALSLITAMLVGPQETSSPSLPSGTLEVIEFPEAGECQLNAGRGVLLVWQGDTATVRISGRERTLDLITAGNSGTIVWAKGGVHLYLAASPERGQAHRTTANVTWPVRVELTTDDRTESFDANWTCAT